MATGVVVVDSNVKKVQHPTGGIVGELNVRDDDHVQEGEVVVRLDETQTKANLSVLTKGLDELYARRARLEAERNGERTLLFPQELLAREASDPVVAHLLEGERKLFVLRLQARKGQKAQLQERIAQLKQEAEGLDEQIAAKSQEVGLIEEELSGVLELWKKQLIQITRLTALKRDAARLRGERGQLMASKASTLGKITETELQVIQVDEQARSQVAEELSDVRAKISETNERKIAAEDQLNHIDIRAPQTGRVHQLSVHTVGGVIAPGETLMLIVPENDTLSIEAKVSPHEIDQVAPDQIARLRFSAFSQQTTPELTGKVSWLSADLSEDERAGTFHYRVRIALPASEFARLKGLKVIPGMPVETFIETGTRTVLSYLLKPLTDQTTRMFRDS
jgi:HlyD family secretion protein